MYTIAFDEQARVLHLTLRGFWSVEVLQSFAAELMARTAEVRRRHERFAVLSDSTAFPVQSAEVAKGFERIMAGGTSAQQGPVAIVVASVLNKLQAGRSLAAPNLAVFLDLQAARDWIAAQEY